jgi:hypothetical protein
MSRNCLLKLVTEEKIEDNLEVRGRRSRRRKQPRDDLNINRGYSKLRKEALDRTVWRTRFGREFGLVRTTEREERVPDFRKVMFLPSSR